MKNCKINKCCPFCPCAKYIYHYKTFNGLLRHVHKNHLKVLSRERGFENSWWHKGQEWKEGKLIYIRCYTALYSKSFDIKISNPKECEMYVFWYATENPSFKGIIKTARNKT